MQLLKGGVGDGVGGGVQSSFVMWVQCWQPGSLHLKHFCTAPAGQGQLYALVPPSKWLNSWHAVAPIASRSSAGSNPPLRWLFHTWKLTTFFHALIVSGSGPRRKLPGT